MKQLLLCLFMLASVAVFAQPDTEDAKTLHETAKAFIRQGDWENATLVITRAVEKDPKNIEILKDQAFVALMQKDYTKSMLVSKSIIDREDADAQCYQILGSCYKAMSDYKECKKWYDRGLKRFPNSGVLHYELGELLGSDGKTINEAIVQFREGIKTDPNYSGNYYYTAKYYAERGDNIMAVFYGENFLNLESFTGRSTEMKNILLEQYKKLFAETDIVKAYATYNKNATPFAKALAETFNKQSSIAANGITPEALLAIRVRFVLDWYHKFDAQFPVRLFEHQQQLLREGIFEAYNQWLFGAASGTATYQNWLTNHPIDNEAFQKFQRNRIYKVPVGQNY